MYPVAAVRGRSSVQSGTAAWSPTDLASLAAWWSGRYAASLFTDAGSTPVAANDDLVYQANDRSGVGNLHLTQSTSTKRFTYKTNVQNGQSALYLDAGDVLTRATVTLSSLTAANAVTVIAVLYQDGTNAANGLLSIDATDQTNTFQILATYLDNNIYFDLGNSGSGGRTFVAQPVGWDNAWHILVLVRNGAASGIYVDGGSDLASGTYSDNADTTGIGTLWLGGWFADNGSYFKGYLGDVIVCNAAVDTADLNAAGAALATTWGLTWTDIS